MQGMHFDAYFRYLKMVVTLFFRSNRMDTPRQYIWHTWPLLENVGEKPNESFPGDTSIQASRLHRKIGELDIRRKCRTYHNFAHCTETCPEWLYACEKINVWTVIFNLQSSAEQISAVFKQTAMRPPEMAARPLVTPDRIGQNKKWTLACKTEFWSIKRNRKLTFDTVSKLTRVDENQDVDLSI